MGSKKAYHVNAKGAVEFCRNYQKCKVATNYGDNRDHWETIEAAEIFLDNRAYLAEVKAKVDEFESVRRQIIHPRRLTFTFSSDDHNTSPRQFRKELDRFIATHGKYPYYLSGSMRFRLKHWRFNNEVTMDIGVAPEIDSENGRITRVWSVKVSHTDKNNWDTRKQEKVLHADRMAFDDSREFDSEVAKLKKAHAIALKESGIHLQDYSELSEPMLARFWEMFDAIETASQGEMDLWYNLGRGDFKDSDTDEIVVDVNYDKSVFSGQSFVEFYQRYTSFYPKPRDVQIRVTDKIEGHPRAWWSFYRKDGVWGIHKVNYSGEAFDVEINSAEELRSHVYWHYINEVNKNWEDIALEKADHAAAVYSAVENEINYFV